jgi:hypothetical protein
MFAGNNRIPHLFFILLLITGCSYAHRADEVNFYFAPEKIDNARELSNVRQVLADINAKDTLQRKSADWLREAYSSLKIGKLGDMAPEDYKRYRKYVDPRDPLVYIIVHPAYYAFFVNDEVLTSSRDSRILPEENIVERFCSKRSFYDYDLRLMQEQERMLKDFLEVATAEKKLVILVLPADYKAHLNYGYINGLDEYVRYINEVTHMSGSVLYMESMEYQTGYIGENDLSALSEFLREIGAKKVMLGGGFAGRCLDNFYASLQRKFDYRNIYIVPEITTVANEDIDGSASGKLFTHDGTINFREMSGNIGKMAKHSKGDPALQIRHLFIYEMRGKQLKRVD